MQCLVLAGGLGTRMESITGGAPKALLPIGPKLFIDWQLMWLKKIGISDVILALGHGSQSIVDYIEKVQSDKAYPQVNYSFDGDKLLGTGGAIKRAAKLLSPNFYVTYGDTIVFLNAKDMAKEHNASGKAMTLAIIQNRNQGDASNVRLVNGEVYYDKFNRTADMDYIDYGMSIVNKDYFMKNTPEGAFDYATFTNNACKAKQVQGYFVKTLFQEIGSPSGYKSFTDTLKKVDFNLNQLFKQKII